MVRSYRGSACFWMWATLKWSDVVQNLYCWVKHVPWSDHAEVYITCKICPQNIGRLFSWNRIGEWKAQRAHACKCMHACFHNKTKAFPKCMYTRLGTSWSFWERHIKTSIEQFLHTFANIIINSPHISCNNHEMPAEEAT
jgi:hypothetical protein